MQLIKSSKLASCITPTAGAAGVTAIAGSVIDLLGFSGALFVVRFGAITATAVTSLKIRHGDAADLSDAADVLGTSQSVADTASGSLVYVDLARVRKRYVQMYVTRGTANAVVADAVALCYGSYNMPTTQDTAIVGEAHVGAIAGTA